MFCKAPGNDKTLFLIEKSLIKSSVCGYIIEIIKNSRKNHTFPIILWHNIIGRKGKEIDMKQKNSTITITFYVVAVLLLLCFAFMTWNVFYSVKMTMDQYSMGFSDVWDQMWQSIVSMFMSQSLPLLVFAFICYGIGYIINLLPEVKTTEPIAAEVKEVKAEQAVDTKDEAVEAEITVKESEAVEAEEKAEPETKPVEEASAEEVSAEANEAVKAEEKAETETAADPKEAVVETEAATDDKAVETPAQEPVKEEAAAEEAKAATETEVKAETKSEPKKETKKKPAAKKNTGNKTNKKTNTKPKAVKTENKDKAKA